MSALVHYIAGGALAILSQAVFTESGIPNILVASAAPSAPMIDVRSAPAVPTASLQQVNRINKGDRLVPASGVSQDPAAASGNEFVAREMGMRQIIKPLQVTPPSQPRLPEGCNSSVSPLSDRVAANQASNCVTALEVPWKVASAQ